MSGYIVALVIGTRPEAIKIAPLAHALAAAGVAPRVVLTGQHAGLAASDHGLNGLPVIDLKCRGLTDPFAYASSVARALMPTLTRDPPDMLLVHGDTSSALGGANAAHLLGLPLGHVEAGLRSHDRKAPWPEEDNRVAIDSLSDLLFAPTHANAANLRAERCNGEIFVTGNTGIDAFLATLATVPRARRRPACPIRKRLNVLVTCHRRENWGDGLTAVATALVELAREGTATFDVILHPNPRVSDLMHSLFAHQQNIRLAMPTTHSGMVERMARADLILSDSGGVQEEAPALGVPLLVLRNKTERPETISCGNARLVGTSTSRLLDEIRALAADRNALARMARPALPFGDGRSAPRIAAIIRDRLAVGNRAQQHYRRA